MPCEDVEPEDDRTQGKRPGPPSENKIEGFIHCGMCLAEYEAENKRTGMPVSPRARAKIEVGYTDWGIQVWCIRHDVNIVHIDFMDQPLEVNRDAVVKREKHE